MTSIEDFHETTCRFCDANVYWCTTRRGLRVLVDAVPVDEGTIYYIGTHTDHDGRRTPRVRNTPGDRTKMPEDRPRYTSHFATCPSPKNRRR